MDHVINFLRILHYHVPTFKYFCFVFIKKNKIIFIEHGIGIPSTMLKINLCRELLKRYMIKFQEKL